ncbi:DUF4157 domain-containing protein [Aetokthonos hydrillicola Thurmond2011]|uniref:DUF4157 domain-containing protein n=3 Tax=Aetokthonos TaxID=1550243 RepID=A0AAP5MC00_9CYAN|nr:DUF4157 domain-containing protein [Aetokthonos hydrillicola]MBW4589499.1 DUF4157 domain-containing protein [Aetokthonos hydrillicola CCALA 1050]MDR9899795.1 DUF4157 domain-containing protein [Aetokthonos hydrillicola Thurmond2011]
MKTNENQYTKNHQPGTQKPCFISATPDIAFFSTQRAESTPFFQALDHEPLAIQAKLTIGEPGSKSEQEADRVAAKVVEQINNPSSDQSTLRHRVQRQSEIKKLLQAKVDITAQQHQSVNNSTHQAQSDHQHVEANGGGEATPDLTSAILKARGGGHPISDRIRARMELAFGADFRGVRVHTDALADHLNRSIHAMAFTNRRDVFFRQGAYNPGSLGGLELLAHELTHVVQQSDNSDQLQRLRPPSVSQVYGLNMAIDLTHTATRTPPTPAAFQVENYTTVIQIYDRTIGHEHAYPTLFIRSMAMLSGQLIIDGTQGWEADLLRYHVTNKLITPREYSTILHHHTEWVQTNLMELSQYQLDNVKKHGGML